MNCRFYCRKYKYNNVFCKKKSKKITQNALKIVLFGFFNVKIAENRDFFSTFVP